jgi:preprotein translocase subunit Sec61beta
MAEGVSTPSGMGGLMRFSEEYPSKFQISPEIVMVLIGIVIILVTAVKIVAKS